jgi:aerobic-type carbon monoxide dehydrogenase small subunit (CoxS/CutS family)
MAVVATKRMINLKVNGKEHTLEVGANEALVEVLRERLRLTGAKIGCNRGGVRRLHRFNRWRACFVLPSSGY